MFSDEVNKLLNQLTTINIVKKISTDPFPDININDTLLYVTDLEMFYVYNGTDFVLLSENDFLEWIRTQQYNQIMQATDNDILSSVSDIISAIGTLQTDVSTLQSDVGTLQSEMMTVRGILTITGVVANNTAIYTNANSVNIIKTEDSVSLGSNVTEFTPGIHIIYNGNILQNGVEAVYISEYSFRLPLYTLDAGDIIMVIK